MLISISVLLFWSTPSRSQVLTAEDSLYSGLLSKEQATVLSGYGEAAYALDLQKKTAEASLRRVVLFVGHKFNNRISLFTELELENALVAGNGSDEGITGKGGISMEQAFLKFNLDPTSYIVAGLFIPRVGFINENHLPTTFNGVDRPFLEELVIPSTWREIGVGFYSTIKSVPGLNYSVSLTNGLNSGGFTNGSGIREGRQLGSKAGGLALAATGSLLYYINDFRFQLSAYAGGSTAVEGRVADSLALNSGPFGNAVVLGDVNGQYIHNGWNIRIIASAVSIGNAAVINKAYASNTPELIYGAYGEAGYDLFYKKHHGEKSLIAFGRYEYMDLSARLPYNGIQNDVNRKQYIIAGLTYKPVRGVAIKLDYVHRITGEPNPALIVTPFPQQIPYYKSNGFLNVGMAYNF